MSEIFDLRRGVAFLFVLFFFLSAFVVIWGLWGLGLKGKSWGGGILFWGTRYVVYGNGLWACIAYQWLIYRPFPDSWSLKTAVLCTEYCYGSFIAG